METFGNHAASIDIIFIKKSYYFFPRNNALSSGGYYARTLGLHHYPWVVDVRYSHDDGSNNTVLPCHFSWTRSRREWYTGSLPPCSERSPGWATLFGHGSHDLPRLGQWKRRKKTNSCCRLTKTSSIRGPAPYSLASKAMEAQWPNQQETLLPPHVQNPDVRGTVTSAIINTMKKIKHLLVQKLPASYEKPGVFYCWLGCSARRHCHGWRCPAPAWAAIFCWFLPF